MPLLLLRSSFKKNFWSLFWGIFLTFLQFRYDKRLPHLNRDAVPNRVFLQPGYLILFLRHFSKLTQLYIIVLDTSRDKFIYVFRRPDYESILRLPWFAVVAEIFIFLCLFCWDFNLFIDFFVQSTYFLNFLRAYRSPWNSASFQCIGFLLRF